MKNYDPLEKTKKCIICDKELIEQDRIYDTNHYLCSYECADLYHNYALWSEKLHHFIIDLKALRKLRTENNLSTDKSILERSDKNVYLI
jgi:hypothetical protein